MRSLTVKELTQELKRFPDDFHTKVMLCENTKQLHFPKAGSNTNIFYKNKNNIERKTQNLTLEKYHDKIINSIKNGITIASISRELGHSTQRIQYYIKKRVKNEI